MTGQANPRRARKKKLNNSFAILMLALFISCNEGKTKNSTDVVEGTTIVKRDSLNALINSALRNNDTIAYNNVASYYILNNMGEDFLFTALLMANKYKNSEACFHVYDIIAHSTSEDPKDALKKMDSKTRNLALYYLLKSNEMGFESAKYQVANLFGKDSIPPSSSHYLKEFATE